MDESIDKPTRRGFLVLAGGALSVGGCSSSSPVTASPLGDVVTVTAASLANPSLEPVGTMPVCIGRDSTGIYAMTLTCTHQGCNIGTGTVTPQAAPLPVPREHV